MTVKVKIGSAVDNGISDAALAGMPDIMLRLNIRRSLDGSLIISDHPSIDIVVMPETNRILSLAKELNSSSVYGASNRLFEFLQGRGVVEPASIQGGNVYASLEATIPQAKELPVIKIALINVAKWLDSEEPSVHMLQQYEDEVVGNYTSPSRVYSTGLGQVPASSKKGSITPSLTRGPYGLSLYNTYGY